MKKGSPSKIFFVRPSLTPLNYRRPLFSLIESRDRSSSRSRSTTLIQRKKGCTKDKLNSSIDDEFGTQPSLGIHRHYLSIVVSSPFSSRNRESKWTVARSVHPPSKYTPTKRRKRTGPEKRKRHLLNRALVVLEIASHDFFLPIRDPHHAVEIFPSCPHFLFEKKNIKPKLLNSKGSVYSSIP